MSTNPKKLLTIAGSDSGGGAGVQADLKTFFALGGYGMSVLTALTAQNTEAVCSIYPVTAGFVGEQLDAIFTDIGADAVKVGMLYDADIIGIVAQKIMAYMPRYVVIDPVMVAKSGDRLLEATAIDALQSELFPHACLITPNIPEAQVLLGNSIRSEAGMEQAVKRLAQKYQINVLLKGGHLAASMSRDVLCEINTGMCEWFEAARVNTANTHGTGCTFSAAIATFLAFGSDLKTAIAKAKVYLTRAILAGKDYRLGRGHGPVNHNITPVPVL